MIFDRGMKPWKDLSGKTSHYGTCVRIAALGGSACPCLSILRYRQGQARKRQKADVTSCKQVCNSLLLVSQPARGIKSLRQLSSQQEKVAMHLNRRSFLQLCSAATAFLTREARPQSKAAAPAAQSRGPAKHREPFVAIQVKPFSWVDEGVDQVLDNLQQKGNVNTIFAYTFDYEESRLRKDGPVPLPDHGVSGGELVGGAFYDYDPKYFQATSLKDFRSKDYGKFDVIAEVAPKAHARGMDFFAWDYNNADPIMARSIPGISYVAEIDVYGRRTTSPCFNHPDYRTFLTGKIESVLSGYSSEVDGLTWGCERMGPINNMIGGGWTTKGICCFCEFCRTKARERGISVERATTGYRKLDQLFTAAAQDQ